MDRSFEVFLGRRGNEYSQQALRRRVNWLCDQARGRVLDLGCSQGLVPWLLGHKGLAVTGIDLDVDAISWARKNLQNATPEARGNVELFLTDFLEWTSERPFDTILVGEYLEHLSDELCDKHLEHMAHLLAPGGRVVITVPLGLHPHPDHKQVFLPGNLACVVGRHFSILCMEAEDAYLRCLCDRSEPRQVPDPPLLLELAERGIVQLQQKARAGNRATKVAELRGEYAVDVYLRQKMSRRQNSLVEKLAARGLWAPFIYDRYLFETLNELYRDNPLVPQPRALTPQGLFAQADARMDTLSKMVGNLEGLHCLEIGCGRGETAVRLAERGKCRVTGVDVASYPEWPERQSDCVRLVEADLMESHPFAAESFDCIISYAVLEHVQKPMDMLEAMFALLKPGGRVFFTANLYRGPMASHRYREVFFPWPHLLFSDAVFIRFYRDWHGRQHVVPSWVNKLTHLHYLEKVRELGFVVTRCTYSTRPFDQDFYECFWERLGCYPREDLERDFINLLLYKPKGAN